LNMGAFFEAKYGILVDTIIDSRERRTHVHDT